jgi:hypothetical protein
LARVADINDLSLRGGQKVQCPSARMPLVEAEAAEVALRPSDIPSDIPGDTDGAGE